MSPKCASPYSAEEVAAWIAEARAGSRNSLNELMTLSRPYLLAAAKTEIGAALRVRVSPEDLVQSTFMEACRDYAKFQGRTETELLAWLRQILHHNLINEVRHHIRTAKRSIRREVALSADASAALRHITRKEGALPSEHAHCRECEEALHEHLRQLPEHYRQALVLHTCEGLRFAEVGVRLGCSAEAARKLWGRAVSKLRNLLTVAP